MKKSERLSSVSFTPQTKATAILNHLLGDSNSKISREYGMSRETIRRWLSSYKSRDLSVPVALHDHRWMLSSPRKARATMAICMVCWKSKDNYFKNFQESPVYLRLDRHGNKKREAERQAESIPKGFR